MTPASASSAASPASALATGRIDVHSHLIPAVDDGCKTIEQSVECARLLVAEGYTHSFCTPHVWPGFPNVNRDNIRDWTQRLQEEFNFAKVPLTLLPGGELNLHAKVMELPDEKIVSMALAEKFILTDIWADRLPDFFEPTVRWLQSRGSRGGLTVILAHPERCRAVQDQPHLADHFAHMGILLQGNLQCFADAPDSRTFQVAEQFLLEKRYFLLGSDTHDANGLMSRLEGLRCAREIAGAAEVDRLTIENPRVLMG